MNARRRPLVLAVCLSPGCCLRRFLAVTCRIAIPLTTTGTEIAMSSANSPRTNGKSAEAWTESRRLATGATTAAIPCGRFGDRQELRPYVKSCASVMSAVLEEPSRTVAGLISDGASPGREDVYAFPRASQVGNFIFAGTAQRTWPRRSGSRCRRSSRYWGNPVCSRLFVFVLS
jgi:hypothetical protein